MHIKTKTHILAGCVAPETTRRPYAWTTMDDAVKSINAKFPPGTPLHVIDAHIASLPRATQYQCVQKILDASNYVIDKPVLDLLLRDDVSKSILALITCGMARLPVSPMTVEYSASDRFHEFVCLEQVSDNRIRAWTVSLDVIGDQAMANTRPVEVEIGVHETSPDMVDLFNSKAANKAGIGFAFTGIHAGEAGAKAIVASVTVAIQLAFLMLNTMGIEKEIIDAPVALNKSRAAKGKPPIQTHQVVHIGKIYRRDGSHVDARGATGRTMPMHIRQAHIRHVPYGPMTVDPDGKRRSQDRATRMVFIPMCIVNFREDQPAPKINRQVMV